MVLTAQHGVLVEFSMRSAYKHPASRSNPAGLFPEQHNPPVPKGVGREIPENAVHKMVERLRERNHAVVVISHAMADVMAAARIISLRLGRANGEL